MRTLGKATLYISRIEGDLNGDVVRVSVQQGTEIVARWEQSCGDFFKAITGKVSEITLINRIDSK